MILKEKKDIIGTSGLGAEQSFSIKTNSKAFSILSAGIYSDPIKAIIRELSCNAYDSHVEAGKKEVPFKVKLPNPIEPDFYVEDFGIGLSEEEVTTLYTTYFESTKTHSNDYVGALGLGSKTPFAYTDEFTVTSRFNGVESTYIAFVKNGVPTISKMGSKETNEHNGLKVQLAVKPQDYFGFQEKAKSLLSIFNPQPEVIGCASFEFVDFGEKIHEENGIKFYHSEQRHHYHRSLTNFNIIQGNICYKIKDEYIERKYFQGWRTFPLTYFEVPIGSVEFTASREDLNYTEETIEFIQKKIIEAVNTFDNYIEENLKEYKNAYEAWQDSQSNPLWQYKSEEMVWSDDKFKIQMKPYWGQPEICFDNCDDIEKILVGDSNERLKAPQSRNRYHSCVSLKTIMLGGRAGRGRDVDRKFTFVFVDKTQMIKKRIEHNLNGYVVVFYIKGTTEEERKRKAEQIVKQFGLPDEKFVFSSDLKYTPKKKKTNLKVYKYRGWGHRFYWGTTNFKKYANTDFTGPYEFDEIQITDDFANKKEIIYVPLYSLKPCDLNKNEKIKLFIKLLNILNIVHGEHGRHGGDIVPDSEPIYGIQVDDVKKLNKKWINIFDYVIKRKKEIEKYKEFEWTKNHLTAEKIGLVEFYHKLSDDSVTVNLEWTKKLKNMFDRKSNHDHDTIETIRNFIKAFPDYYDLTPSEEMSALTSSEFYRKYPMMEMYHKVLPYERQNFRKLMQSYLTEKEQ